MPYSSHSRYPPSSGRGGCDDLGATRSTFAETTYVTAPFSTPQLAAAQAAYAREQQQRQRQSQEQRSLPSRSFGASQGPSIASDAWSSRSHTASESGDSVGQECFEDLGTGAGYVHPTPRQPQPEARSYYTPSAAATSPYHHHRYGHSHGNDPRHPPAVSLTPGAPRQPPYGTPQAQPPATHTHGPTATVDRINDLLDRVRAREDRRHGRGGMTPMGTGPTAPTPTHDHHPQGYYYVPPPVVAHPTLAGGGVDRSASIDPHIVRALTPERGPRGGFDALGLPAPATRHTRATPPRPHHATAAASIVHEAYTTPSSRATHPADTVVDVGGRHYDLTYARPVEYEPSLNVSGSGDAWPEAAVVRDVNREFPRHHRQPPAAAVKERQTPSRREPRRTDDYPHRHHKHVDVTLEDHTPRYHKRRVPPGVVPSAIATPQPRAASPPAPDPRRVPDKRRAMTPTRREIVAPPRPAALAAAEYQYQPQRSSSGGTALLPKPLRHERLRSGGRGGGGWPSPDHDAALPRSQMQSQQKRVAATRTKPRPTPPPAAGNAFADLPVAAPPSEMSTEKESCDRGYPGRPAGAGRVVGPRVAAATPLPSAHDRQVQCYLEKERVANAVYKKKEVQVVYEPDDAARAAKPQLGTHENVTRQYPARGEGQPAQQQQQQGSHPRSRTTHGDARDHDPDCSSCRSEGVGSGGGRGGGQHDPRRHHHHHPDCESDYDDSLPATPPPLPAHLRPEGEGCSPRWARGGGGSGHGSPGLWDETPIRPTSPRAKSQTRPDIENPLRKKQRERASAAADAASSGHPHHRTAKYVYDRDGRRVDPTAAPGGGPTAIAPHENSPYEDATQPLAPPASPERGSLVLDQGGLRQPAPFQAPLPAMTSYSVVVLDGLEDSTRPPPRAAAPAARQDAPPDRTAAYMYDREGKKVEPAAEVPAPAPPAGGGEPHRHASPPVSVGGAAPPAVASLEEGSGGRPALVPAVPVESRSVGEGSRSVSPPATPPAVAGVQQPQPQRSPRGVLLAQPQRSSRLQRSLQPSPVLSAGDITSTSVPSYGQSGLDNVTLNMTSVVSTERSEGDALYDMRYGVPELDFPDTDRDDGKAVVPAAGAYKSNALAD